MTRNRDIGDYWTTVGEQPARTVYVQSPVHEHTGIWQEGLAATDKAAGFREHYVCACGKLFEDAACTVEITDLAAWQAEGGRGYLPPLTEDDPGNPGTGDTGNPGLGIALLVLSLAALRIAPAAGRKKGILR